MKEIKSVEELNEFNDYLSKNPFSPNKIKYNGLVYVINNSKCFEVNTKGSNIIEDCYHPGYYIYQGLTMTYLLYKVYKLSNVGKGIVFKISNPDTYVQINITKGTNDGVTYLMTADAQRYEAESKIIISAMSGEHKPVQMTDLELESFGFVRGKVNPGYWFHSTEVEYIDTMLPYKKFDNTYTKHDLKQYESNLKENGVPCDEIKILLTSARKNNIIFGVDSPTYKGFEGMRYTFGVEIETCIGRLDPKDYEFLNVKAVHDGSLRDAAGNTPGGEFVTGILTGDAGLAQLAELCRILALKCKLNEKCGVHVHCGNLDWTKEDICFSYILAEQLEDELFSMLPKSRRSNSYCRRLTQLTLGYLPDLRETRSKSQYDILIDRIYNDIFKEVTYSKNKPRKMTADGTIEEVTSNESMNRSAQHPNGAKCGYDKNAQRYCWLNFVTLLYNTKGLNGSNTLELRSHSATMNFNKIKNWIKVFFAICKYVENNKTQIKMGKVTLEQIMKEVYPQTGHKLIQYIEERKQLFKSHDESVDYVEVAPKKRTIKEIVEVS